jgi:hypothetical protein
MEGGPGRRAKCSPFEFKRRLHEHGTEVPSVAGRSALRDKVYRSACMILTAMMKADPEE